MLLTAAIVLSLMPGLSLPALAASHAYYIDYGFITISQNGTDSTELDVTYYASSGAASSSTDIIPSSDEIVITQTDSSTATANVITVSSGTARITLQQVNISTIPHSCISIISGAAVELTLSGANLLYSLANQVGIQVPSGASVIIDKKTSDTSDTLTVQGGTNSAGIGGGFKNSGGTITINGGTVTARSYGSGAGIGGGFKGSGGTVTINGGCVYAEGGKGGGAGIGAGSDGAGGTVKISGSAKVTAIGNTFLYIYDDEYSYYSGAGIGGGDSGAGGTVIISGGTVVATGGTYGASDIGKGGNAAGDGDLYISGGSVNADFSGTVYQTSAKETAVYKTVVSGLNVSTDMTCAYNGGAEFSCATDSNGYLYLWLPEGNGTVCAYNDGSYCKAAGTIDTSNSNMLTAVCISITTASLPVGVAYISYSETLVATGGSGSFSWSTSSALPSGITLSTDGVLSGKPVNSSAGSYSVIVAVTDASDPSLTATKTFTLTIQEHCGNGAYLIASDGDGAYTGGYTGSGIPTLTVNSGVTGFKYFRVNITTDTGHAGAETCVFVQMRSGQQIAFCFLTADFDILSTAGAGFNVKPGDVIEVYLVDSLSNSGGSPSIL